MFSLTEAAMLSSSVCCICLAHAFNPMGKAGWLRVALNAGNSMRVCFVLYHRATSGSSCQLDQLSVLPEQRVKSIFVCKNLFLSTMSAAVLCRGPKRDAVGTSSVRGEMGQDRSQSSSKETRGVVKAVVLTQQHR